MSVTIETEAAYRTYIDIQVELKDAKVIAKSQINALQLSGEKAANIAKNAAYNAGSELSTGAQIRAAVQASKTAFTPYREQIQQIEANLADLQTKSDAIWKAYEVVRGIGA